jgi:hypothetical protein
VADGGGSAGTDPPNRRWRLGRADWKPAIKAQAVAFLGTDAGYFVVEYGQEMTANVEAVATAIETGGVPEAFVLLPAHTDTAWSRRLNADWVCLVTSRIQFGTYRTGGPFPSALQYIGPRGEAFAEEFRHLGTAYQLAQHPW